MLIGYSSLVVQWHLLPAMFRQARSKIDPLTAIRQEQTRLGDSVYPGNPLRPGDGTAGACANETQEMGLYQVGEQP